MLGLGSRAGDIVPLKWVLAYYVSPSPCVPAMLQLCRWSPPALCICLTLGATSAASLIIIGASLGEMLIPLGAGTGMAAHGPKSFVYFIFFTSLASSIVFVLMWRYGYSGVAK